MGGDRSYGCEFRGTDGGSWRAIGLLDLFAAGQGEMGQCVVLDVCSRYW
jgi:hypothetical protein